MKRLLTIAMSAVMILGAFAPAAMAENHVYSDYEIEGNASLADFAGLMNGYEDGTFRPNNPITRAEFIRSVMIGAEFAYPDTEPALLRFTDLDSSHWAYNDVAKAVSLGIIDGYEDGTFRPNDNVTYEQAAAIIFNLLGYKPVADMYGGYPHAYMALAYNNRFFKTDIEGRNGVLEMDIVKETTAVTRRDALHMLSGMLTTPMCIVKDYMTAWDGSREPIYSIGGDGELTQTLYVMKNVRLINE